MYEYFLFFFLGVFFDLRGLVCYFDFMTMSALYITMELSFSTHRQAFAFENSPNDIK